MYAPNKAFTSTSTHLVVSERAVLGLLTGAAVVGIILAAFGLSAAYDRLGGPQTTEGTIVSVAIVIAHIAMVSTFVMSRVLMRRATRPPAQRR